MQTILALQDIFQPSQNASYEYDICLKPVKNQQFLNTKSKSSLLLVNIGINFNYSNTGKKINRSIIQPRMVGCKK